MNLRSLFLLVSLLVPSFGFAQSYSGARITAIALDPTSVSSSQADIVQGQCDLTSGTPTDEPFEDDSGTVTLVNEYPFALQVKKVSLELRGSAGTGKTVRSLPFAPLAGQFVAPNSTTTVRFLLLDVQGRNKALAGLTTPTESGFTTLRVTLTLQGPKRKKLLRRASTTISLDNFDGCG